MTKFATRYWIVLFISSTTLTILVNGAHAKGALSAPGTWTATLVAMLPPALFAALAEGYFLARRSVPPYVHRVVFTSGVVLAAAAFAVSYETQRLFVIAAPGDLPSWVGWVIPAMLDTTVAVSGYVLYVIATHGAPAPVAKRPHRAGRLARIADNLGARVEKATAMEQPRPAPRPAPAPAPTQPSPWAPPAASPVAQPDPASADPAPAHSHDGTDLAARAEIVIERTGMRTPLSTVSEALAMLDAGAKQITVATKLNLDPRTISKIGRVDAEATGPAALSLAR